MSDFYSGKQKYYSFGRLFVGFLLFIFGILLLFQNLGLLERGFSWWSFADFWPIILMIIAFCMMKFRSWLGAMAGLILTLFSISLIILLIFWHISSVAQMFSL